MRITDCNTCCGIAIARAVDMSSATLLAELDRHRVAEAWTYSLRGLHLADEGNAETLALAARHPSLVPVAVVDPHQPHGVDAQIARCLRAGVRLFRLCPAEHRWRLDSQPFYDILDHLHGSGAVLLLPLDGWGDASTMARLTAGSGLPVVLMNVHYTQLAECSAVMGRWPHLYAVTSRLATPHDVEALVGALGAGRLLFGSEAPRRPLQCALNHIWFADLSDADRAAIFGGNAARLLAGPGNTAAAPAVAGPGANAATANLAGRATAAPDAAPPPRSPVPIVDVHAHLGRLNMMADGGLAALAANRTKYNIGCVVVSSTDAIAYDLVDGNRQVQQAVAERPWLYGYIVLDPNDLAASVAELDRYAGDEKFVGVKIHSEYARVPTASPPMHALFAELARRGRPSVVKIHNAGEGWERAIVAYAREFPRLRIIVAHAGPGEPVPEAIEAAATTDNVYLEFCTTYPTRGIIRDAIARAGIGKILFGSDQMLIDPGYVLGAYQDARPTAEEWEQIAWRNACRLFDFPQPWTPTADDDATQPGT